MNGDDSFEKRLQGLPQRQIPAEWRQQILSAARDATNPRRLPSEVEPSLLSSLNLLFARLLWPHPKAWASLAAVWVLVLGLNLATREPAARPQLAQQATRPTPQLLEMLRQQQQSLAELVGPLEQAESGRSKTDLPQPRSQRRQEFFNA